MTKSKMRKGPHTGLVEGETVEFKQRWVEDAMKDIVAFANRSGGTLYLGVDDDGHVVPGADVSDKHQQQIANKIVSHFQIVPSIQVERRGGMDFLAVTIPRASGRAILLRNTSYQRAGSTNHEISGHALPAFVLEQTGHTWDALAADATLDDIDPDKVRAFIQSAHGRQQRRLPAGIREADPVELNLDKLELLNDGRPTNAAMLLFGRDPQRLCRHARTRVFFFRDINDFDEYPTCKGTVGEQIDAVVRSVAVANPTRITFPTTAEGEGAERLKRHESVAYPELALKEAITNALIHRDYTVPGSDVEVKIYSDRLVIQNPGALMPGVTTEDLKKDPHPSRRRNPLLADVASKDHWVEQAGTGTTRMIDLCVEAGLPAPEFENRSSGFTVTFRRSRFADDLLRGAGLSDRQVEVMLFVAQNGEIDNSRFQEVLGVSKRTASSDLTDLVKRGFLKKLGGSRGVGVRYVLAE